MAHLLAPLRQKFYDSNGEPLALGKVFTYEAGTTTPLATYQDKLELAANTNPIILDANGEADIWLLDQAYKFRILTSADVLVKTIDNVSHNNLSSITPAMIDWNPAGAGLSFAADTLSVNVDSSTIEIDSDTLRVKALGIGTNQLAALAVSPEKLQAVPTSKLVSSQRMFLTKDGKLQPLYSWSAPIALTDPSSLPSGTVRHAAWSPDGRYLAFACSTTPFVVAYERSGDTFYKLANPSTLPTGDARYVAWSPDGQFLAVAHTTTPFITIYQRSGYTLTKLTNPASLPALNALSCAWSPDGRYLTVTVDPPGLTDATFYIYERNLAAFTLVYSELDFLPLSLGGEQVVEFSPSGNLMITAGNGINIYSVNGSTFTEVGAPASNVLDCQGLAFSPNGLLFAVAHSATPFITVYSVSGTTLTKLANPSVLPVSAGNRISFNGASDVVALTESDLPCISAYSIADGVLTKLSNPSTLPSAGRACAFSPNGKYLATGATSGDVLIYKTSSSLGTDAVLYASEVIDV